MTRIPGMCGVILAAGESTRMGRDKALLPWPPPSAASSASGGTFLSAAIASLAPFTELVIVVVGKNEDRVAPVLYANGASLIRNHAPERGQFSSLQVGLQEVLSRGRDSALVTLVDRPPVSQGAIEVLAGEYAGQLVLPPAVRKWAVVPEFEGKHGHPILVARELIEAFLKAPATASAREIRHQHEDHIQYVPVDDPRTCTNVDTPQDYANLSG
jgi:molybdenum cofactor cytidylyltransferase